MQTEAPVYERIVLKLSGEAMNEHGGRDNISPPVVRSIAERMETISFERDIRPSAKRRESRSATGSRMMNTCGICVP